MKDYKITQETRFENITSLTQCNFHGLKEITFYGLYSNLNIELSNAVAIWRYKYKTNEKSNHLSSGSIIGEMLETDN